jgi:hypothetical protein
MLPFLTSEVGVSEVIKVKRDGERGWHWVAKANFDPKYHEVWVDPEFEKLDSELESSDNDDLKPSKKRGKKE